MGEVSKQTSFGSESASLTHDIDVPAHLTGDLAVLILGIDANITVTFTSGLWTERVISTGGSEVLKSYTMTGAATPITSDTITLSSSDELTGHWFVIPDGDTANPISASNNITTGNTTKPQSGTITPAHNGTILITAIAGGAFSDCLHPEGWLSAGTEKGASAVQTTCSYKHMLTASPTGAITFPYGGNSADIFATLTLAIKCNTVVDEARVDTLPSTLEHNMGYFGNTEGVVPSDITPLITTINSLATYYQRPSGVDGGLFESYYSSNVQVTSNSFTDQYLLTATNWTAPKDYTGKVFTLGMVFTGSTTLRNYADQGIYFGLYDDTNTAYKIWGLKGNDSIPSPKTKTNILVDVEGGYEDISVGTGFDISKVSHIFFGKLIEPSAANDGTLWLPVHSLNMMKPVGGNATRPASFETMFEYSETNGLNTVQKQLDQATGQYYITQSWSIGDGSTDTVWDSTAQGIEMPGKLDFANGRVQSKIATASLSGTIDTNTTLTANVYNFGDFHQCIIKSGIATGRVTAVNATPIFTGGTITGWTFSRCKAHSGVIGTALTGGNTFTDGVDNSQFVVSTKADFEKLQNCTFLNHSNLSIQITGNHGGQTWLATGMSTSGGLGSFDIDYTGTGTLTITVDTGHGFRPTGSGGGTLTLAAPVLTLSINTDSTALIRYFQDDLQTIVDSDTNTTLDYVWPDADPIDIEAVFQSYVPINRQNVIPIDGDYDIEMDFDEVYNENHSLAVTTHYTYDRGTKVLNILADQNALNIRSSIADLIRLNSSYYNTPLLMDAIPGLVRVDQTDGMTVTDMQYWKGAGSEVYHVLDFLNPIEKWYSIQSVGNIAGATTHYRNTNSGNSTAITLTNDVVDETFQYYADANHDGTPDSNTDDYLLIKSFLAGSKQGRLDVLVNAGVSALKSTLYTIPLSNVNHGYTGVDPAITGMTLVTGGVVGDKAFAYKWVDANNNSGADIADWINMQGVADPNGVIPGGTGLTWFEMPDMVIYNGATIETENGYEEGVTPVAVGFYVERSGADHPDFTQFESDTPGDYYIPAVTASITVSNLPTDGNEIRLEIYNITQGHPFYSGDPASASYFENYIDADPGGLVLINDAGDFLLINDAGDLLLSGAPTFAAEDLVRIRFAELNGASTFKYFETFVTASSLGFSVDATNFIITDEWYTINAVDGSSAPVTAKFAGDFANDEIDFMVAGNWTSDEAYAFFCLQLTTEEGIDQFWGGITAAEGAYRVNVPTLDLWFNNNAGSSFHRTDSKRIYRSDGLYPAREPTSSGFGVGIGNWLGNVSVVEVTTGTAVNKATVKEALTEQGYTAVRAPNLDNVDIASSVIDGKVDLILEDTGTTLPNQISGVGGLDAAATRAALGLAVADLDSQLATIDGKVDAVLVDTNELQLNQGDWLTGVAPNNAGIAAIEGKVDTAIANGVSTETKVDTLTTRIDDFHNIEGLDVADPVVISGDGETESIRTTTRLQRKITLTGIERTP